MSQLYDTIDLKEQIKQYKQKLNNIINNNNELKLNIDNINKNNNKTQYNNLKSFNNLHYYDNNNDSNVFTNNKHKEINCKLELIIINNNIKNYLKVYELKSNQFIDKSYNSSNNNKIDNKLSRSDNDGILFLDYDSEFEILLDNKKQLLHKISQESTYLSKQLINFKNNIKSNKQVMNKLMKERLELSNECLSYKQLVSSNQAKLNYLINQFNIIKSNISIYSMDKLIAQQVHNNQSDEEYNDKSNSEIDSKIVNDFTYDNAWISEAFINLTGSYDNTISITQLRFLLSTWYDSESLDLIDIDNLIDRVVKSNEVSYDSFKAICFDIDEGIKQFDY